MYILKDIDKRDIEQYDYVWRHTQLEYIINNIKSSLIEDPLVDEICFYCKSPIDGGTTPGDIEHIVPKKPYKFFTYEPKNLTLSCDRCNSAKGNKKVLIREFVSLHTVDNYPTNPLDYKIVHAHFDNYENCITLKHYIFFKGIDAQGKGKYTIDICNLHRLELALSKIKQTKNNIGLTKRLLSEKGNKAQTILSWIRDLLAKNKQKNIFEAVINICKDKNIIKIIEQLSKINNIEKILTSENVNLLKKLLNSNDNLEHYFDFISYLHSLKNLVPQLVTLIDMNDDVFIQINNRLLLNKKGLNKLKTLLNSSQKFKHFKITSKTKLINMLDNISIKELPNLQYYLEEEVKTVEVVIDTMLRIYRDTTIDQLLKGVDSTLVGFLDNEVQVLLPYATLNPKLRILSDFKRYYNDVFKSIEKEQLNKTSKIFGKLTGFIQ